MKELADKPLSRKAIDLRKRNLGPTWNPTPPTALKNVVNPVQWQMAEADIQYQRARAEHLRAIATDPLKMDEATNPNDVADFNGHF
jgi:hypothetical protein